MHENVCCFIGSECAVTEEIKRKMQKEIQRSVADGYRYFVTGLLTKLDIAGEKIVLEERKKYDVKLICYPKYEGFYNKILFDDAREEIMEILNKADEVIYFYPRRSDIYLRIGTVLICSAGRAIGVFDNIGRMLYDILELGFKKGVEIINIKKQ